MSLKKLNEKSKEFELPNESINKRENGRLTFVSKFPLNFIKDLSIDEYVQGTDDNSFCYWLEFKKILFGIGGGNASKFGIYKAKDGKYYTSYGKSKRELTGQELKDSFNLIKAGIVQALEYTKNDQIDKIKTINLPLWNMVLQKILSIYYPDKFITIGAPDVLIECARDIELKGVELKPENSIKINYECKKALSSLPEYSDWHYEKIGSYIWQTYLVDSKRDFYILGSKYGVHANQDVFPEMLEKQVIATDFASQLNLEEFYLKNHSEITEYLSKQGEEKKSYNALKYFLTLKVGDRVAIKADGSPKGKKGFLSIIGIAEVIEKDGKIYRHDPDGLGHLINVKFIKAPVYKEFDLGGYGRTIHKLSKPDHIDLIFKSDYEIIDINSILKDYRQEFTSWLTNKSGENSGTTSSYIKAIDILSQIVSKDLFKTTDDTYLDTLYKDLIKEQRNDEGKYFHKDAPSYGRKGFYSASIIKYREFLKDLTIYNSNVKDNEMDFPLNTIFYGPPGTGKTFNSINESLRLLGDSITGLNRKEIKSLFKKRIEEGRIVFTTFHQSMSYEDFIEGIKPTTTDDTISYIIEDGIFKQLCYKSLFAHYTKGNDVITEYQEFDNLYESYIQNVEERLKELTEDEKLLLPLKSPGYYTQIISINEDEDYLLTRGTRANTDAKVLKERLRMVYNRFKSIDDIKEVSADIRSVGKGLGWSSNYYGVFKDLKQFEKSNSNQRPKKQMNTITYNEYEKIKNFISNTPPLSKYLEDADRFVLIIDEINRGSVSQIFGELITLLEEDKRLGNSEELTVTLPYSKSTFGVPPNLFVLGTMNTADRSVEALDTALRRRFSFTEMAPKPKLINTEGKAINGIVNGIELSVLLETINKRIEKLLDKDHMIGHSYFISIEELSGLKSAFQNKIVPLLQEYFFGDYGKIGLVIGSKFFDIKDNQVNEDFFAPFEDYDSSSFVERKVYHLKNIKEMSDDQFIEALNDLQR